MSQPPTTEHGTRPADATTNAIPTEGAVGHLFMPTTQANAAPHVATPPAGAKLVAPQPASPWQASVSPSRRAWHRFRRNRLGFWSLLVFVALVVLSLGAELISNDRPLVVPRPVVCPRLARLRRNHVWR